MKTPRASAESGFTLVELLIYSLLAVLVLAVVGGMFVNGLTGQRIVRSVTEATSQSQLAVESVERGVRNAQGLSVTSPNGDDMILIASTADMTGDYELKCVAWYYSAADHELRTKEIDADTIDPTPTATELENWRLLLKGIEPIAAQPVFSLGDKTVTFQFQVEAGDQEPVTFTSASTSRAETLEVSPCS